MTSRLLDDLMTELCKLPSIGKKTAMRLALHLANSPTDEVDGLAVAIHELNHKKQTCKRCCVISDGELCEVCSNPKRNHNQIMVVQTIADVLAIEDGTGFYTGVFHVLGGVIDPLNGVSVDDIESAKLIERVQGAESEIEIIFALTPNVEGDTTQFYLQSKLKKLDNIKLSSLSRGISMNREIQDCDPVTLQRSLTLRSSL